MTESCRCSLHDRPARDWAQQSTAVRPASRPNSQTGDRTRRTASSAGPGDTESISVDGRPALDDNDALVVNVARLARAVRELAADLARARRDCRDKQRRIDSLHAENARLLAAAPAVMRRDDRDTEVPRVSDEVRKLGAQRCAHEHALERMSCAVLVLRRGNLALKQENTSLRLELASLREQNTGRDDAASAELPQ
jgi:hypothetical protein